MRSQGWIQSYWSLEADRDIYRWKICILIRIICFGIWNTVSFLTNWLAWLSWCILSCLPAAPSGDRVYSRLVVTTDTLSMWESPGPMAFQWVPVLMPATFYIKQYHPLMCWHIEYLTPLRLEKTVCAAFWYLCWIFYPPLRPAKTLTLPCIPQLDEQTEGSMCA